MRKITIEIEVSDEYVDVCAELVVEDFLRPQIGFTVVTDPGAAKGEG